MKFFAKLAVIYSSVLCYQDLLPHCLLGAPAPAWPMALPVLWLCSATILSCSPAWLLCSVTLPVLHLHRWQCLTNTSLSTGTVAVWNLLTKSLLQCVHQPDTSLKLYPFQCFPAHDHAVRSIEWCKADR